MTDAEHRQAAKALIDWFSSQDIKPADAGMVMAYVIATSLLGKSRDIGELSKGLAIFDELLSVTIATLVRA